MSAIGFGAGLWLRERRGPQVFSFLGETLPAGATLTRTSVGTRIDAAGLVVSVAADGARIDHDPATLGVTGLLYEPAATNLVLRSGTLDHAAWSVFGSATRVSGVTAPDGTASAVRLQIPTDGQIAQYVGGLSVGAAHCVSLWVRASASGGAANIRLTTNNGAAWSTGVSARIALTASWQRVSVSGLISDGAACNLVIGAAAGDSGLDSACLGNVDVWGAQIETGAVPTSYIATTAGAATRAAEALTLGWGGLGVADGARTIRYMFDDGSTQDVSATIAGGVAAVPLTLARRRLGSATAR